MVYGNRTNALIKPNSIILSKRMANKYFPNEDPIGKIVILNDNNKKPFVVGGVMEDLR